MRVGCHFYSCEFDERKLHSDILAESNIFQSLLHVVSAYRPCCSLISATCSLLSCAQIATGWREFLRSPCADQECSRETVEATGRSVDGRPFSGWSSWTLHLPRIALAFLSIILRCLWLQQHSTAVVVLLCQLLAALLVLQSGRQASLLCTLVVPW